MEDSQMLRKFRISGDSMLALKYLATQLTQQIIS